jgi:glutathione S-transferase
MLKIWGRTTSSNVQKVLWCCAELGLEYERVDLGGPFGGNQDPEYLPSTAAARSHVERWMDWQLSSIGPPMGALLFGLIRTRPEQRDHAAVEAARRKALAAWSIADDALADRSYLAGDELSLAEITLGTLVYRWHAFPIERPALKNLRAWFERLRERPAFKKHIEIPIT